MFSDLVELLGLGLLCAGIFVLLGLGAALLAGGACLVFVGQGVDDEAVKRAVARQKARVNHALTAPARRVSAWRARPKAVAS